MSDWFYIRLAYGITWATLTMYLLHLVRRSRAAASALHGTAVPGGGER